MPDPRAGQPDQPPGPPPPGWFPDPYAPEGRTGRRWWTGRDWSEHVVADPPGASAPAVTPDGVPIAGMGARIGAYAIDGVALTLLSTVLGLPFLLAAFRIAGEQFDRSLDAARSGAAPPSSFSLYDATSGPLLGYFAVSVAVTLLYHALFLRWRAATPGKLAVGLRVRSWGDPGSLGWPVILRRMAAQYWYLLLVPIPLVGNLFALYALIDNLSALGNPQRRALHDRFADTVVVDARSAV